ncbi:MATE family efflux transporter [Hyphococcus flavus]|uniref:MATE family efflux transporter n=1 Tax=Hyphococcus flavus TaxID=1866326 RepID=A0AAF0CH37_9PROT|nr:MATE family efflux transporter [Hyphococcus flavus]WDI33164.1 MATE family efflux transporter [Hyphococcus flavus]
MTAAQATPAKISVSYGKVFRLAWPASVAASVTPLLGAIDVWALAQSARPLDIAAVGLGAVIFSLAYWTFGFLRMSVAGLTAQAVGAEDETEARATLARGVMIAGAIGIALVLLQWPIGQIAFQLLGTGSEASAETLASGRTYFNIRIWGAPFALASYCAFGWLTARGRTDYLMAASVFITALNILLDYWFVVGLGWGAAGVATGTLIAEVAGFFATAFFVLTTLKKHGGIRNNWRPSEFFMATRIKRTISINVDIFIRTLLLAFSFSWFVQRGGAFGDVTLAANQALLQLFLFTGLAIDGTAIAAETLAGQALGAKDKARGLAIYKSAVRRTFELALAAALLFMAFYWLAGDQVLALLTPEGPIRETMQTYMPWVIISPLIVMAGFQLDGIFVGATRSRELRDAIILSTVVFIPASLWLAGPFGNHGLWAAFSIYFLIRAVALGVWLPRIKKTFET